MQKCVLSLFVFCELFTTVHSSIGPGTALLFRPKQSVNKKMHLHTDVAQPPRISSYFPMKQRNMEIQRMPLVEGLNNNPSAKNEEINAAGSVEFPSPTFGRFRRENGASSASMMSEISSVEVLPIIRKCRTIDCRRDRDGLVSCRQDDLQYKIRLKHPNLPQDLLEALITNLYARLFKATNEKKKRDGGSYRNSAAKQPEETPFIIILPPDKPELPKAALPSKIEDLPTIDKTKASSEIGNPEDLIIECAPAEDDSSVKLDGPLLKNDPLKNFGSLVYSCRWIGKRSTEAQRVVIEKKRQGPPLQSFQVLIDPSKVGINLLPITVIQ